LPRKGQRLNRKIFAIAVSMNDHDLRQRYDDRSKPASAAEYLVAVH
jgi:hypothetical protein